MNSLFRWATALLLLLTLLPAHRATAQTWQSAQAVPTGLMNWSALNPNFTIWRTVADGARNTYVICTYRDTITLANTTLIFNGQYSQAFVGKISPTGQWLWIRGSTSTSRLGACTVADLKLAPSGDILITGSFSDTIQLGTTTMVSLGDPYSKDAFVAQLSPAGAWQWITRTTHPNTQGARARANGITTDANGNILVCGTVGTNASFGPITLTTGSTTPEAFVAKLTASGNWQWVVTSSASQGNFYSGSSANRITIDSQGNAVVLGQYDQSITLGTTTLTRNLVNFGTIFVARVSPTGAWQWAAQVEAASSTGSDVAVDAADNVLLTGGFPDSATFGSTSVRSTAPAQYYSAFLARLSAAGTWQWGVEAAGGPSPLGSYGGWIMVNPAGNILLTGVTSLPVARPVSVPFVAMYAPTGVEEWRTTATALSLRPIIGVTSLEASGPDEVRLTGTFKDVISFGSHTLASTDSVSLYVAYLNTRPLSTPADRLTTPLTLAPNPAHETVQLTGAPDALPITLLDALGRTVRTYPAAAAHSLDVRGLTPGLYSVRAGSAVRRLVVE